MESFRKLGLSEEMIKVVVESKFTEPSEIQERTIPLALAGKDIIGGSATGSGKTLAFGASIIEKAQKGKKIQALILTPTRELAEQVSKVFVKFSRYKNLGIAVVYGGVGMSPQIDSLRHADIVVGTPGRILDHLQRGTIDFKHLTTLVLDEADRMLDMGFIEDVNKIISACPKERQTFLFSATISSDISHMAKKYMKNPVEVSVESYVDPSLLKQIYYDIPKEIKFSLLVHLLKNEKGGLVMVFCNTRHNTDFVARNLLGNGVEATAIHGGLSQQKRNSILQRFHSQSVYVLVCTDVAARGLDIKGVSHVYNYDIPTNSKEYVHRIGRTARAGKEGIAINLVSERDYENFRSVLRDESLKIEQKKEPENIERVILKIGFKHDDRRPGRSFGHSGGRGASRSGSRGYAGGRRSEGRSGFGGRRPEGGRDRESGGGRSFGQRGQSSSRGRDSGRSFSRGRSPSRGRSFGRRY